MVSFPNAKINIGLRIVSKRTDGFHNIETAFYPVALKDAIEIIEANNQQAAFSQSGMAVPGSTHDNLCTRAYQLLKKDFPHLPQVKIHLHKAIPVGGGLGGGSADAAFILTLANQKFELGLSLEQLNNYALKLGSDCPFFINNKPCYATGRGEIMEAIPLDLSAYDIFLVNPGIHINTGWAFSQICIEPSDNSLKALLSLPIADWQTQITNDFEKPVFAAHPEIATIKNNLVSKGGIYVSMSGSGSTVYGIFKKDVLPGFNFPAHYCCKWV